jgi:hypothetical protein
MEDCETLTFITGGAYKVNCAMLFLFTRRIRLL